MSMPAGQGRSIILSKSHKKKNINSIQIISEKVDKELYDACKKGNLTKATILLESACANPSAIVVTQWKYTPLHIAVFKNKADILELLLTSGNVTNIDVKESYGRSPLLVACYYVKVQCALILLKHEAHVNAADIYGDSALHLCIRYHKDLAVFKECLNNPAINVNHVGYKGRTPLMRACRKGNLEMVNLLLKAGADMNIHDEAKRTALYYAGRNDAIAGLLLQKRVSEEIVVQTPFTVVLVDAGHVSMSDSTEVNNKSDITEELCVNKDLSAVSTHFNAAAKIIPEVQQVNEGVKEGIKVIPKEKSRKEGSIAVVKSLITEVYPECGEEKFSDIISAIEKAGVDLENPEELKYLQEKDFLETLQPVHSRRLIEAFSKKPSLTEELVLLNF